MPTAKQVSAFPEVFAALKQILVPYAKSMKVMEDTPIRYTLGGTIIQKGKHRETMLIAVYSMKNYVSLHIMPIYMLPGSLPKLSPELQRRMQGKACFNFSEVDDKLFKEAAAVVKSSMAACKAAKLF